MENPQGIIFAPTPLPNIFRKEIDNLLIIFLCTISKNVLIVEFVVYLTKLA